MQMGNKYIALIPAYEPDNMLLQLDSEASSAGLIPVVVDDGSGAEYRNIFDRTAEYGTVLRHEKNRGKGAALKTGLTYIREHCPKDCIVVTMDSDGQHKVGDAIALCNAVESDPAALVLGCRKMSGNVPVRSRFGNSVTRNVFCISTGLQINDTQTGLRAFHSDMIPFLMQIPGDRYEYEMNMLLECADKKIPIIEKEIETVYFNKNKGSHFHTVKDSIRVYKEIIKFSASSFIGFLIDYGMFSLLSVITGNLPPIAGLRISNIGARAVSASVNYTMNRKLVFKSNVNLAKSAFQYFLLATCILAGNTILLTFLAETIGINRYISKLIAELIFFTLSWVIQRTFVFQRGKP